MKKNKVKQNKSNMFNADMKEIRVRILERKEQVALENFLQEKGYVYEYDLPEFMLSEE